MCSVHLNTMSCVGSYSSLRLFTGVLGTISRMAKTCALRLTPTKLYFILADTSAIGGVSIWCELKQVIYQPLLRQLINPLH